MVPAREMEVPPSSGLRPWYLSFHVCSFIHLSHKHLSRIRSVLGSGKADLGEEDRLEAGRPEAPLVSSVSPPPPQTVDEAPLGIIENYGDPQTCSLPPPLLLLSRFTTRKELLVRKKIEVGDLN